MRVLQQSGRDPRRGTPGANKGGLGVSGTVRRSLVEGESASFARGNRGTSGGKQEDGSKGLKIHQQMLVEWTEMRKENEGTWETCGVWVR